MLKHAHIFYLLPLSFYHARHALLQYEFCEQCSAYPPDKRIFLISSTHELSFLLIFLYVTTLRISYMKWSKYILNPLVLSTTLMHNQLFKIATGEQAFTVPDIFAICFSINLRKEKIYFPANAGIFLYDNSEHTDYNVKTSCNAWYDCYS